MKSETPIRFLSLVDRLLPEGKRIAEEQASEMNEMILSGNPAFDHWGANKIFAKFYVRYHREQKKKEISMPIIAAHEVQELIDNQERMEWSDDELIFRMKGVVGDESRFDD